jgi:hypothetical protein
MQNWDQTLLSQYASSPTIVSLLESFNDAIDPSADLTAFYNNIWNVSTAVGSGLDIWGAIVGVSRYLEVDAPRNYFGFNEALIPPPEAQTFPPLSWRDVTLPTPNNAGIFYSGYQDGSTYELPDPDYRKLILVKAAANISNLSVPAINALLRAEFSDSGKRIYVQDNLNMTYQYVYSAPLTAVEIAIIVNSGVFPRPAGVQLLSFTLEE